MHAASLVVAPVAPVHRPGAILDTHAPLQYVPATDRRPVSYAYPPPEGEPWENTAFDARVVAIADARCADVISNLDTTGVCLQDAPTAVRDFDDPDAVRVHYYPEMAALARQVTGARQAIVFDHLVRRRRRGEALDFGRRTSGSAPTANGRIHNDYTEASGRRRAGRVLGGADAESRVGRYAIVNLWRSIRGIVLDAPLAFCDARTVQPRDLVEAEVHYRHRTGEIYFVRHSPRHRWSYFPELHPAEVLVFKQFDTTPGGTARFTPHSAFIHPQTPADAPPRESIEVRCLVLFDEEAAR